MCSCVIAGALKEVYDAAHPATHTVEIRDFLNTAYGAGIAGLFVFTTGSILAAIGASRTVAAIFWVTTGVFVGRSVLKNILGI